MIGPGVTLGPNVTIPKGTRLTTQCPALHDPFYDKSQPLPGKLLINF